MFTLCILLFGRINPVFSGEAGAVVLGKAVVEGDNENGNVGDLSDAEILDR